MSKPNSKRKTRSDKFPLTLHKTGQFCKKIRGKLYYFGTNKQQALQRYLEQASYLHNSKQVERNLVKSALSLKTLCNLYLDHQESRVAIGEIKFRHVSDQIILLRDFVKSIGSNKMISDISTIDLQNYRKKLIKAGKAPNTINNRIAVIKAMYHWALDNEIIQTAPNLKALKKITNPKKEEKLIFSMAQVQKLFDFTDVQMKAMIWLGSTDEFG